MAQMENKKISFYIKFASVIFSLGVGLSIGGLIENITYTILIIGISFLIISGLMFIIATFNKNLIFRS